MLDFQMLTSYCVMPREWHSMANVGNVATQMMSHKELDIWKQMARKADFQLVPPFVAETEVKHLPNWTEDFGMSSDQGEVGVSVLTHEFQELHAAWFCNMGYPQLGEILDQLKNKKKTHARTHTLTHTWGAVVPLRVGDITQYSITIYSL